jgi:Bacteriocin-protection, YdeI or OmpD-Associated/Domain of unknown function (DUF1905)
MPQPGFEGRLESDQGACFIRLPPEVLTALGRGKRVPVKVTIKSCTYRTTVAVYGGKYYLGVRREVREAAGVTPGEQLMVGVEYDAELRTADLPDPVRAALDADPAAAAVFQKLSFTRQKEVVDWVRGAMRSETQARRIKQAMAMLRARPKRR